MTRKTKTPAPTALFLLLSATLALGAAGCDESDDKADSYTEVTPKNVPGLSVEVLEPLRLTDRARIPQNDSAYDRVEVFADRLVVHYATTPTIEILPDHIIAGGDPIGYLRKVVAVTVINNRTLEVSTESADLGDFILSGHFRVTQEPLADDWIDEEGDIKGRCYPLGPENSFSFFQSISDEAAVSCKVADGSTFKVAPTFTITPRLLFEVDFDPGWLQIKGELAYAKFGLEGKMVAGIDIDTGGEVDDSCDNDFIEALRTSYHNDQLFRLWAPEIRFAIGPVPVVISRYFEPRVKSTVTAKVKSAAFSATAQIELDLTAGTELKDGAWSQTWEADPTGSINLQLSQDTSAVDLASTLSYGVVFTTLLYSTSGPEVGLSLGGSLTASTAPSTCTWHAGLDLSGVDALFATDPQLPVLDPTLRAVSGTAKIPSSNITHTEGPMPVCTVDGGVEAGVDASVDAGVEAGVDAGVEAGVDAGVDAKPDTAATDAATDSTTPDA